MRPAASRSQPATPPPRASRLPPPLARSSSSSPYPPESRPTPSARARRAASRSHTLSPTTTDSPIATPRRSAAARNKSGSGLACCTWSRVMTGTLAGTPSMSRVGLALSMRPHLVDLARERLGVVAADLGRELGRQLAARLAEQRVHEQPAAHPDAAMDPPHRQLDPGAFQRLAPGEHVLVHAVHQRAVEVEQKRGTRGHRPTVSPLNRGARSLITTTRGRKLVGGAPWPTRRSTAGGAKWAASGAACAGNAVTA